MAVDPSDLLSQLVAIPSVNPMGRQASGSPYLEERITRFLEGYLDHLGVRCRRQPVEPGRDNLIARIDGPVPPEKGGTLVLLAVHQDTVPVDGMTIDPFSPRIERGRLFGRGACDVKGGMAALLAAVAQLAEEPRSMRCSLLLAFTVNEEYGFTGAQSLSELLIGGDDPMIPRKPDAAVVLEPTELNVVTGHKGVVRWRCHTRGRAAHSAEPSAGVNAIYRMARVLLSIEAYQQELADGADANNHLGLPTVSVGTISGGSSVNTVPAGCTIEIDRRLVADEQPGAAQQALVAYLSEQLPSDWQVEHDPPYMQGLPLSGKGNGPWAEHVLHAARQVHPASGCLTVPYATDAGFIAATGIPTVVFGPGSLAQAHTADEWIALDQLQAATAILVRVLRSSWP